MCFHYHIKVWWLFRTHLLGWTKRKIVDLIHFQQERPVIVLCSLWWSASQSSCISSLVLSIFSYVTLAIYLASPSLSFLICKSSTIISISQAIKTNLEQSSFLINVSSFLKPPNSSSSLNEKTEGSIIWAPLIFFICITILYTYVWMINF